MMIRALIVLAAVQLFSQASAEELRIGNDLFQRRDGKVIIPPALLEAGFEQQRAGNPNAELKQPAMYFKASARVGSFGMIKSHAERLAPTTDPPMQVAVQTELVLAQRMGSRSGLVRATTKLIGRSIYAPTQRVLANQVLDATFFFEDFDFSIVADGARLDLEGQTVIAAGIYEYTNTLGAKSSVLHIVPAELPQLPKPLPTPVEHEVPTAVHQAFVDAKERNWSDVDDKDFVSGTVYNFANGELWIFLPEDGSTLKVPIARLSRSDQNWVKNRLKDYRSRR